MRLLRLDSNNEAVLTEDLSDNIPPYAILSHTWGADVDEVTFSDLQGGRSRRKKGYAKIQFCGEQAQKDGIKHFWIDTCCIDKANLTELTEAITSMFRWYRDAVVCYAYLSDVSTQQGIVTNNTGNVWEASFRTSRWFTRGWTLQELLAPSDVRFFSCEKQYLGSKIELAQQIHEITTIPITALRGTPLPEFSIPERMRWAEKRQTKKKEDRAYCLQGIFEVYLPLIYGEGEHAFVRLQKAIIDRSGPSKPHVSPQWLVFRAANPLFTGREELLQKLEIVIRDAVDCPWDRPQCRVVISGMGGQGKSEICLQLARRLRQLFGAILWIDFNTQDLAERSFVQVAQKLAVPAETWQDACLGIANLTYPWLLILDNADEPNIDYQDYFPDGPHGVIFMTTRNHQCQQYGTDVVLPLEGLGDNDAKDLLLKAACLPSDQYGEHDTAAREVANLLQSHALALIQAGAYIARGHCTLAEYPQLYERQRQQLLTFRPMQARSRYRDVYATFEVSAAMLAASQTPAAQDALDLLPLLAVGVPNHFPTALFQAAWHGAKEVSPDLNDYTEDNEVKLLTPWHVKCLPAFVDMTSHAWDTFRLTEAIGLLKAFSLISTGSLHGVSTLSVHPLVHAWARDRQNEERQQQNWLSMGCVVALAKSGGKLLRGDERALQPHIETLTDWSTTGAFSRYAPVLVARILVNCGWWLYEWRSDKRLYALLRELFMHLQLNELTVDNSWIGLYNLTAQNAENNGRIRVAVDLLEQLVKIREQTLAEDHPNRLASQHVLAMAYRDDGQAERAVALLERVVKIEGQTLAEDHPDRLSSQHELAVTYRDNGQAEKAVALLEHVVKIREQTLAEDHPDRLASQHTLAVAYRDGGQVERAVALLERVVKIREQTLAEDHPDRLASQQVLAMAYRDNGQVERAVELLEQVVKIEGQTLAEDHPDRLASQHELAGAYRNDGQVEKAVALLERVVKIREQTLAEDHPDRLISQQAMAALLWERGEHSVAYEMMHYVAEMQRRMLIEGHPERKKTEDWLVLMKNKLGLDR